MQIWVSQFVKPFQHCREFALYQNRRKRMKQMSDLWGGIRHSESKDLMNCANRQCAHTALSYNLISIQQDCLPILSLISVSHHVLITLLALFWAMICIPRILLWYKFDHVDVICINNNYFRTSHPRYVLQLTLLVPPTLITNCCNLSENMAYHHWMS